ncbi:hypothetical protein EKPJFOCH_1869 [Methylobacterium thuringiense]|uniref:Uncharacterized protein n=1 Tax=Methylobacterium thuringiense TaxID=1003091 RepID=A0ABQ4TJC9_9HYPH|nr:hypothetical protein EKPJFOCH_1869 [Methylobacterium thuringiense]
MRPVVENAPVDLREAERRTLRRDWLFSQGHVRCGLTWET